MPKMIAAVVNSCARAVRSGKVNLWASPGKVTAPGFLVATHAGYALRDKDLADVAALCERFGITLPDEYR